jgi:energy-converting hydrogenase Eha subunit E
MEWVALGQGCFYVLSGVWPLVSMGTFLRVTGPKTDLWLVKTVAALIAVIGLVLLLAAARQEVMASVVLLAVGAAASLAVIDVVYVIKRVIGPVYLLDAVAELGLVFWWGIATVNG